MRLLATLASVALLGTGSAAVGASADGPLEEAREAMKRRSFSGTVRVVWVDSERRHVAQVSVRAANGVVQLEGPTAVVDSGANRMVLAGDDWHVLWPEVVPAAPPPLMASKYEMQRRQGPVVAGRRTELVELVVNGTVRERLALDPATGLVLSREQLGPDGSLLRQVRFETIRLSGVAKPVPPASVRVHRPGPAEVGDLPAPYRAPRQLEGGYRRLGAYWREGVLHVLYSDGLYRLSVFQHLRSLDATRPPARAEDIALAGGEARRWAWPGGSVVTWTAGEATYTVVGDGPPAEVLDAARSLPRPRPLSAAQRLLRTCRGLVESLSGRD